MFAGLSLLLVLARPTDLVFVRHGETVANATGHYSSRTLNVFSPKGQAGVDALTKRLLAAPPFDRILVSPSPRALRTIAPYLRAAHRKATIWPLLYECCTGRRPKHAAPTRFSFGEKIRPPKDIADLFVVLPGQDRVPVASDYDSGLAQVEASLAEFRSRYLGGRVLLVGHSGHGGQLLHGLTGGWRKLANCREVEISIP
jgi:broad specificity phosphatase PhoE